MSPTPTMWQSPAFNEDLLNKYGCVDDLYKALASSDLSEIVVAALEVINKTGTVPLIKVERKSEAMSTDFRKKGNEAYMKKKYQEALILYNKALQYAPVDSKVMKLAFSNRSALFLTVKAYGACMDDIDLVFEMDCPPEIEAKLEQRHKEARTAMQSEDSHWKTLPKSGYSFCNTPKEMPNPQIPCATKNVGIIMKNDLPMIVAANHVKVGTILAIEPAYVNHLDSDNLMIACYYCHRMDYNLVPCEGCCHVMFCNEYCMRDCMNQYHSAECKIMDLLHYIDCTETLRLALKAAMEMKLKKSWSSLIESTKFLGANSMQSCSISEIFGHNFFNSLLNWKEERHFIYGAMYNASFKVAAIIHYLGLELDFFPEFNERCAAIQGFARIIMYLYLYGHPTLIVNAVSINDAPQVEFHKLHNFGFFSFAGKLKNSCMPNVMMVGLNDKVALVALEPISRGTELTIAYAGHWLDKVTEDSKLVKQNMFVLYATVCNCVICSGAWKHKTNALTPAQRYCYNKICLQDPIDFTNFPKLYKNLCRALTALQTVPFSHEYVNVYRLFRTCVLHFQHVASENIALEHSCPKSQ